MLETKNFEAPDALMQKGTIEVCGNNFFPIDFGLDKGVTPPYPAGGKPEAAGHPSTRMARQHSFKCSRAILLPCNSKAVFTPCATSCQDLIS